MKNEIKKFFKGDIEDDLETLKKYSHDASIFEVQPKLVIFPKDAEDVKNLVKWVNQKKSDFNNSPKSDFYNLSITARSAGTDMSGGPLNESIIMDFTKHMNKLIEFNHPALQAPLLDKEGVGGGAFITVQPGMFYRDFEKIVSEKGLMMPSYPASKGICAMGGIVANNSGGEKTLKYGKTEDYIQSMKVVFTDGNEYEIKPLSKTELEIKIKQNNFEGNIYKKIWNLIENNREKINKAKPNVSKNSAGYYIWNVWDQQIFNLNKLLVGSQGTLGIVTEVTFKLVPIPKESKLAIIYLDGVKKISDLTAELLKFSPESLEVYDDKTLQLAIKFFPSFLKNRGFWGGFRFICGFWPDLFMLIRNGFPKLVVLAEFASDDKEEIYKKIEDLSKMLKTKKLSYRVATSSADAEKYWKIRRESFNLLRNHVKGKRTMPFIDDVIVRPEYLSEFLPKLEEILSKYPELEHTIAGHAGDGNFHIIPLVKTDNLQLSQTVIKVADQVYNLVLKYKGSITAEHNDGIIRTPYLEKMFGVEICRLFTEVKNIFDPQNIFNPGKKTAGDFASIRKYIIKPN